MSLLILAAGSVAAELKIAVIDTQRALVASEEAQSLLQQAQQELAQDQADVESLGQEILASQEKLQTGLTKATTKRVAGLPLHSGNTSWL